MSFRVRSEKQLMELLHKAGNDKCADCGRPDPSYASYNLGVFICESCAGIHRGLGTHVSKIKSIKLDSWEEEQIMYMEKNGNDVGKLKFEANIPPCYRRPLPKDPQVLRDQWIRAKYERLEFVGSLKQSYLSGRKEGQLWKRGKDDKHFQKRRFILDASENTLKYYNKEVESPKAALRLDDLNVTFVPDKVGNPNAMQITYENEGQTRNLFVYAEIPQEAVEWYTAIRSAKLNRLAIAYPAAAVDELCRTITRDFVKEGWLSKTGPRSGDAFRKRWVTIDKRKLLYYEDPMDAYAKGEVYIGTKGYEVSSGFGGGTKDSGFGFVLKTPDRSYQFSADAEDEQRDWIDTLNQVINDSSR